MLQGIWKPRKIENPDYFEDKEPFKMTSIVSMNEKQILSNSAYVLLVKLLFALFYDFCFVCFRLLLAWSSGP